MRTIDWNSENKSIVIIDQTLLPKEYKVIECSTLESLCEAIKSLRIRGAPALGAAGGFGVALIAFKSNANSLDEFMYCIKKSAEKLIATRPTAVNLSWGVKRVLKSIENAKSIDEARKLALKEAKAIANEDIAINKKLGEYGASLLEDGDTVLTYCNAGRLACVDWGTALGVIRSACELGKKIKVIACETRPLNQGSRITTWELMQDNIPVILITDNMVGYVMKKGMVNKVIVGADRITIDAVFNKIGTYSIAVLAKHHEIPFYVAAPTSTFDLEHNEYDIKIEMRNPDEVRYVDRCQIAPNNVEVYNPAFDATPIEYISAIITEKGIIHTPSKLLPTNAKSL